MPERFVGVHPTLSDLIFLTRNRVTTRPFRGVFVENVAKSCQNVAKPEKIVAKPFFRFIYFAPVSQPKSAIFLVCRL